MVHFNHPLEKIILVFRADNSRGRYDRASRAAVIVSRAAIKESLLLALFLARRG